jgi:hypothetical protein
MMRSIGVFRAGARPLHFDEQVENAAASGQFRGRAQWDKQRYEPRRQAADGRPANPVRSGRKQP